MTILFFKNAEISPNLGGIARINYTLSEALKRIGYKTLYVAIEKKYKVEDEENQFYLPNNRLVYSEENVEYLHKLLLEKDVDVIINNDFSKSAVTLLAAARRCCKVKLITWVHNNTVEYSSLVGYRKEAELRNKHLSLFYVFLTSKYVVKVLRYFGRYKHQKTALCIYKKCDKLVMVSPGNIKDFIFLLGQDDAEKKIIAISNFIPDEHNDCDLSSKKNTVVWCGNINFSIKKTNWMLDIWQYIERYNKSWDLKILGDSDKLDAMKVYARGLGLQRVTFTGRVTPQRYYKEASILCSTSITESFGLTLVEGMQQMTVPIAFASSPSIRDIIGEDGVLIKPFDRKGFAKQLLNLIEKTDIRKTLAERCFARSKKYEEVSVIEQWKQLFNSMLVD